MSNGGDPANNFSSSTVVEVQRRLQGSKYAGLRNLCCEFSAGVLTLRGDVSSFFLMQVAQTIAAGVEDVEQVSNLIQVSCKRQSIPSVAGF